MLLRRLHRSKYDSQGPRVSPSCSESHGRVCGTTVVWNLARICAFWKVKPMNLTPASSMFCKTWRHWMAHYILVWTRKGYFLTWSLSSVLWRFLQGWRKKTSNRLMMFPSLYIIKDFMIRTFLIIWPMVSLNFLIVVVWMEQAGFQVDASRIFLSAGKVWYSI